MALDEGEWSDLMPWPSYLAKNKPPAPTRKEAGWAPGLVTTF